MRRARWLVVSMTLYTGCPLITYLLSRGSSQNSETDASTTSQEVRDAAEGVDAGVAVHPGHCAHLRPCPDNPSFACCTGCPGRCLW